MKKVIVEIDNKRHKLVHAKSGDACAKCSLAYHCGPRIGSPCVGIHDYFKEDGPVSSDYKYKELFKEVVYLANAMYDAGKNITTDASKLNTAMNNYRQFMIRYNRESKD